MGFDAQASVEPLDYDLKPFVDAEGTIPEPTTDHVEALFKAIREQAVAAGVTPGATREEAIEAFSKIPEDIQRQHSEATLQAVIDFCQGTPSEAEIRALPFRPLQMFTGWLVGQFAGEAGKADTQPSRATANGASPSS